MRRERLPISALPAWCKINNVGFFDIQVQDLGAQGYGITTTRPLSSEKEIFDITALLLVPNELILSKEFIDEHAKVDKHFRELLDVAGGKSLRGDCLLFLVLQITITSKGHGQNVGVSNPWTEYVKMLPDVVHLPTLWTVDECVMLRGTSLESALSAKSAALLREYESLREATANISWCQKCWWGENALQLEDWTLVDAWFRSRSLEHPIAGESMIPSVDMVNHSSEPNSYYEPGSHDSLNLLLRPGTKLTTGTEITISYGASKTPAEMLFSYGFIDEEVTNRGLTLAIGSFSGDPLGKAKAAAFFKPQCVRIFSGATGIEWDSPFLYLLCLNEEDGLEFRLLQENDGSTSSLRTFWQNIDVSDATDTFKSLIENHPLRDIFNLRAISLLESRFDEQLQRLNGAEDDIASLAEDVDLDVVRQKHAILLREDEKAILVDALCAIELQKNELLESYVVLRYLGSMEEDGSEQAKQEEASNNEDDFS